MDVKLYKPKSDLLKKHIVGFCFINKGDEVKEYIISPNNYTTLSISTQSVMHLRDGVLGVSSVEECPNTVAYISQYKVPLKLKYSSSPVNQLVLFFKPFGVNHFVLNIADYMPEVLTTQFCPFKDLEPTLECILSIENRTIQLEIIELYLLSIFYQRNDSFFCKILEQVDKGISKSDIAIRNNVSVTYLDNYFHSVLGKSIAEYILIQKQQNLLRQCTIEKEDDFLYFDDLFLKESELLKRVDTTEFHDLLFSNLDFNPQRLWFVL